MSDIGGEDPSSKVGIELLLAKVKTVQGVNFYTRLDPLNKQEAYLPYIRLIFALMIKFRGMAGTWTFARFGVSESEDLLKLTKIWV